MNNWWLHTRGWARSCYFTGILDSWCLNGIYWMLTFFWNIYGKVKPIDPLSPIQFWSYWRKSSKGKNDTWKNCISLSWILFHSSFVFNKHMRESENFSLAIKKLFQETINFLKWISPYLVFGSWYFLDLREDKEFTDVTLACEDGLHVEAHKVVLIASSPCLTLRLFKKFSDIQY